ncbi:DMT family transporter [Autumnicola psychrophila]|uniref:DMT family transporter n=1 Tax=Autumnicola psychrophila TaxID=3075592 RepID=A0ABU3DRZ1_9FLAO|nr:DMT family transporter [Zunongwangia sp. F225]MDT0686483.1 DMT family transporter [Zunongwangia sp. F225]
MKNSTIWLIVVFVLLWNSGFIGAEYGLPYTGPFTLIFLRYFAVTVILFFFLFTKKKLKWVGLKTASQHMLIGFLAHGVWLTCALLALDQNVPAGIVALLVALQPMATGALSGYVTKEKISLHQWLGLIIGFVGVVLTVAFRIDFNQSSSIFGYLIPLGSVIAITIATLMQRKMELENKKEKLPLDQVLFYQSFATMLVLFLPALYIEDFSVEWLPNFTLVMIWLILAVSIGAYVAMWLLIERLDATRVASLFYLGPPVTMFMAWLAFGDTIMLTDIIGISIVIVGILFTQN